MRLTLSYLLLAGIVTFAACKKDHATAQQKPTVIGDWAWVQQTNAIGVFGNPFDTLTPLTTDTMGLLSMEANSSWSWTVNHETLDQGTFAIDSFSTPGGMIAFLVFHGSNDQFLTFIGSQQKDSIVNHTISPDNDSLFISNALYVNTYTVSTFIRVGSGTSNVIAP